jgi:hypothetical protein
MKKEVLFFREILLSPELNETDLTKIEILKVDKKSYLNQEKIHYHPAEI